MDPAKRQPPPLDKTIAPGLLLATLGFIGWLYFVTRDYQVIVNDIVPATWLMAGFTAAGCAVVFASVRDWRQTRDALREDELDEIERQRDREG
ncbi:MAG: hypothetical protein ACJ790_11885 [Myxococcaceae bacterium]